MATLRQREELDEGLQEIEFAETGFASGVYSYRVESMLLDGDSPARVFETRKMLLLK